jgi:hypothetical protein
MRDIGKIQREHFIRELNLPSRTSNRRVPRVDYREIPEPTPDKRERFRLVPFRLVLDSNNVQRYEFRNYSIQKIDGKGEGVRPAENSTGKKR